MGIHGSGQTAASQLRNVMFRFALVLTAFALVAAACAAPDVAETTVAETTTVPSPVPDEEAPDEPEEVEEEAEPEDVFGPPETTSLTVGIRLPNVGAQAPWWIARELGFYADEGLDVEIITSDAVREALVGGSMQIAAEGPGAVGAAFNEGVEFGVLSTWLCRSPLIIAVAPGIDSVEGLEGEDILLGAFPGDPTYELRADALADAGWDIRQVNVNPVTIPGGSDAWVEGFLEGSVSMTIYFDRHRTRVAEAGATTIVDETPEDEPTWVLFGLQDFINENPNTAGRFLRATMRAVDVYKDLGNQDEVLDIMAGAGFTVEGAETEFYEFGTRYFCDNLWLEESNLTNAFVLQGLDPIPAFEDIAIVGPLHNAQESLDLPQGPTGR